MEIIDMKLNELKQAEYNPRFMNEKDMDDLNESIKHFGLVDPVIFHVPTKIIIGGNQRDTVLNYQDKTEGKALILGDVGWFFTDYDIKLDSEEDIKMLNIALNKISGAFDEVKLTMLFEELKLSPVNINLTGFSDDEISKFDLDEDLIKDIDDFKTPNEEYTLKLVFDEEDYQLVTDYLRGYDTREQGILSLIRDKTGDIL
jgi:ParB-like chromosome segregation protein Spo0J